MRYGKPRLVEIPIRQDVESITQVHCEISCADHTRRKLDSIHPLLICYSSLVSLHTLHIRSCSILDTRSLTITYWLSSIKFYPPILWAQSRNPKFIYIFFFSSYFFFFISPNRFIWVIASSESWKEEDQKMPIFLPTYRH